MHFLLKYKMLQLKFKISLCGLLHVSVHSDHHQGAVRRVHAAHHLVHTLQPETHTATTQQPF
jgi:hypothetical protein